MTDCKQMQPSLFDEPVQIGEIAAADVAAALENGALLLTASATHAIDWKRRITSISTSSVTPTPCVSNWQEWICELADGQGSLPVALNRMQEIRLWEKVIRDDQASFSPQSSASLRGLARHARDAFILMCDYRMDVAELTFGGEEAEALARWIKDMFVQLGSAHLSGRTLTAMQGQKLLAGIGQCVSQSNIIVDGFGRLTPLQQAMLDALQESGKTVVCVKPEALSASLSLTPCSDQNKEFRLLAKRIKNLIEDNPATRIGVALCDSIRDTQSVRRILDEVLMPDSGMQPEVAIQAVNMAANPLSELPMIHQLLHMLSLAGQGTVSFSDFSPLLFSPWLKGYAQEWLARSDLDRLLRRRNRHLISLNTMADSPMLEPLPELKPLLVTLSAWDEKAGSVQMWVSRVFGLLQQSGFVQLSSEGPKRSNNEIRQMNALRDCLSSLVSVDAVSGPMNWSSFLSLLRSACSEAQFGLPVQHSNVTVLPLNQIAGLKFDQLFVAAFDEEAFPLPVRAQPLLPPALQQKFNIAMSRAELAFEHSNWLWQQLLNAADVIEISYAVQRNEQELHVSPFARALPQHAETLTDETPQSLEQTFYADGPDVPLQSNESIRGGTALIRDQSACPFRAFATYRLGISELDETEPGIEATTKGSLIHLALEYIWQQLGSRSALIALDEQGRSELIGQSIAHAWQEQKTALPTAIKVIEQQRMATILNQWLVIECERPDFEVVAIESAFTLQLPENGDRQLAVQIKVDRIDRDSDGATILIDYKTGAPQSFRKWLGQRIEEPQLPIYAVAAGLTEHDVVAYGRLRTGQMGFEGLSGEVSDIKGITACDGKRGAPEDWHEVLTRWHEQIDALAAEFVAGRCEVAPRDVKACRYCGLEALCRIEERGFAEDIEDEL